ncbi:MAG TPA: YhgE/Pip domain-containing protein [Pseudogracilibacillus sp.]|nr:YhgE/Pip domain-containing protein [Pseudogracilibacillus sp.]
MFKSLFNKESLAIFKDRKLIIAIIAIIFVPILYAGMFLWAFWDPYAHLADVPVAIVNEDDGHEYEGEYLELGAEFVDNLKEEDEFDFHFVDKDTGYQGLHEQDYYILIEIPNNFSKNATTVMNDTPEKIELIYKPNESYNFLAAQIGETAMLQIEAALEEKITETYAETIFDQIDEVADGLAEASNATAELNDGASELKDGSGKLQGHLKTLAEKSIEFTEGVETAYQGVSYLADGSTTLTEGIGELYDNSNKLKNASEDLKSGANELADGISATDTGVQEMKEKVPQLADGTKQVHDGLGKFHEELPKAMSKQIDQKLEEGSKSILDGTNQLRTGIVDGLENTLSPELSKELTDGLSKGLAEGVVNEANKFIGDAPEVISHTVSKEVTNHLKDNEAEKKNELINILQNADVPEETIQQVENKLKEFAPNYDHIEQIIDSNIESVLEEALKDVQITQEQQKQLEEMIRAQITDGIENGVNDAVNQTVVSVNTGFDEYEQAITDGLNDATNGLDTQIKQALNEPIGELQGGLTQLNEGQSLLQDGINQLADGTNQLKDGSQQLTTGQINYVNNMYKFTNSFAKANDGSKELAFGANKLFSGMFELKDGSLQLSDGAHDLSDGSNELHDGMNTLVDGTEEFNDKMHEAAEEASDVHATEETHNMMANPVEVANEKINNVPNYGTGFAPYFLSLGLFVGALLLSIVYPLREPSVVPSSGFNWFLRKFLGLFAIGILQAIIASGILLIGLGIEVKSVPLFILFAIITSLVFITLIQFLVTCFDDPGRFMAIIILILQLTTSAGTFPLELIPKALQPFNALLPMTYSVTGFKAVVSSGDFGVMWQNAGILLGFTIVFMLLTLSYFIVMYKRKFGALGSNNEVIE